MPFVFRRSLPAAALLAGWVVFGARVAVGEEATHSQSKEIVIRGKHGESLQTFCLGPDGKIFAVVAKAVMFGAEEESRKSGGGEIRVLDADGKQIASWNTEFTPQRIAASPSGEIVVGGDGRLARFTAEGKLLAQVESPHLASVLSDPESLRKAAEEQRRSTLEMYEQQIKQFDDQIKQLKELEEKRNKAATPPTGTPKNAGDTSNKPGEPKRVVQAAALKTKKFTLFGLFGAGDEEDTPTEATTITTVTVAAGAGGDVDIAFGDNPKNQLQMYEQMVKSYRRILETEQKKTLDDVVRQITLRLQKIHGIAAGKDDIYVATAMSKGYGFAIWRMTAEFQDAKQIVSGLSGCCGQIDVQCDGDRLFVAENSRHRVVSYDRGGKRLDSWGKRDRDGEGAGFGGCCNPMNLTFLSDGAVLTSESEGLVKRFSKTGDFLGLVGKAKVSGGCKNVAIGAASDGSRVYFYDLAGSKIIVLTAAK